MENKTFEEVLKEFKEARDAKEAAWKALLATPERKAYDEAKNALYATPEWKAMNKAEDALRATPAYKDYKEAWKTYEKAMEDK